MNSLVQIKMLHAAWNRETGQNIRMGVCAYELECGYLELIRAEHSVDELVQVVRYLKGEIAKGNRKQAALRWSNVVGDLLRFEEELELARGAARKPKAATPLQRAMNTLRPAAAEVKPEPSSARPVKELIDNLKRAAGMRTA